MPTVDTILDDLIRRYPDLQVFSASIRNAYEMLLQTARSGGKILLCGNGGSAADCSHIAGELLKQFNKDRGLSEKERKFFGPREQDIADHLQNAIPALSLPDQGVIHSAFANDVDGQYTFAQLVWALGRPGDTLWALSTSGNSVNVIHALTVARRKSIQTLGMLGRGGGKMKTLCDIAIVPPGKTSSEVQERHLPIYHALCLMLEEALF